MELVQKFTNDLVKAFIAPSEKVKEKKVPMVTIQNASSGIPTVKTNGHQLQNGVEAEESSEEEEEEDLDDDVQIL